MFRWLTRMTPTPRLVILSVFIGVIGGLGAKLFLILIHLVETYFFTPITGLGVLGVSQAHALGHVPSHHWYWLIPVATTVGGLVSGALVYTFAPEAEGHGTDAAVKTFHRAAGRMRARVPFIKTIASAITIGSGGSAGREGPTAQIAAGIGSIVGELLDLSDTERRWLVLMGMAAGLSAIFKSPLGTAIFAVEILYSRMAFEGAALVYTMISAAVGYTVIGLFDGFTPLFILPASAGIGTPIDILWFALLGIVAGGFGAVMPWLFYGIRDIFRAWKIPNHVKPAVGGLIFGLIAIALPPLLGGGYGYMQFALQGGAGIVLWMLFLLSVGKMLALSLTVSSGGSGGVFAPSLYVGAMMGAAFGAILHHFGLHDISIAALAVVGMAAFFAGAARVPIASLVMVIEMTGGFHLIMPTMLAVAISFMVQFYLTRHAKYPSLYEAQVPTPAESPVHRGEFYQAAAELLRREQVTLDQDILTAELQHSLERGEGIPLSRRKEHLYSLQVPPGSPSAGREIRSLGLSDLKVLIVGIIRGDGDIVPHGGTTLQVGDGLLVASDPEHIEAFRALLAPKASGEKPGSPTAEDEEDMGVIDLGPDKPDNPEK